MWNIASQSIVTITDGKVGTKALRMADTSYPNQGSYVPIDPLKKYRVKFWARPVAATNGLLYFCLQQFTNDTGATCAVNGGRSPYKPSGHSRATHNALFGTDAWGEYNYVWSESDFQAGVKFVRPDLLGNYSGTAGYWEVQGFSFIDATDAELNTAAIQTEATTRATQTGELYAQYTVKLDVGGKVSGYGLASTGPTGTGSTFEIRADKFVIAPEFGATYQTGFVPFTVLSVPTTIDGVDLPAGAYATKAFIQDLQVTAAKIASVKADSIQTGYLSAVTSHTGALYNGVNAYTLSTNAITGVVTATATGQTPGTAGFGTGYYLANNTMFVGSPTNHMLWNGSSLTVRGTVYATAGQIGGITIAENAVRAGQTAYNTGTGFHLGSDGKFSLGNSAGNRLTWDGTNINIVGGGTFSGDISAATGTFSGGLNVKSAASGARMEIKNNVIKVFDASGVLRVKIGDLSA